MNFRDYKNFQQGFATIFILIAILIVISMGAGAYFYFQKTPLPKIPTQIIPSLSKGLDITLGSPSDGVLVVDNKITVKGKTKPQTTVMFYTDTDQNSVDSDDSGNFEGTLALNKGINTLTVTAFSEDGEEKTITVDVVNDSE